MAQNNEEKSGFFKKILDKVEHVGNKLPQPVTLFAILMGLILILSWIFGSLGVSVKHPAPEAPGVDEHIKAVNLLDAEGIRMIMTNMVDVFAEFPPLGLVLAVMIGIGVAERSGLITVALRIFVDKVPNSLITFSVVIAGMFSSIAVDAGYVVLIPLGATIFMSMGRHPLAGLAAAFAGVSGGFGANFIPTAIDPLIASFTQPAAQIIDPEYTVNPLSNYYLMAASVPLIGLAGTWVTEKLIVPRLGKYEGDGGEVDQKEEISPTERKGLRWAIVSVVIFLGLIALAIIPSDAIFRDADGSLTPFYNSIVPLMLILFFIAGLVYGLVTKSIKGDKDVAKMTADSMSTMGGYIVLAFVAAQFVAYFNWSNLGLIVAVSGASGLQNIGFTGIPLLVAFILVSSLINLLIGSASAKWAIMAPIFVPMLMLMGFSPETTQAAYRIGDSYSNILTPLLPYFPLIITFAQKYDKSIGLGTIISTMLPYAILFAAVRIPMLVVWILLDLPLGIEGPIYY